jgi:hypothetical protein
MIVVQVCLLLVAAGWPAGDRPGQPGVAEQRIERPGGVSPDAAANPDPACVRDGPTAAAPVDLVGVDHGRPPALDDVHRRLDRIRHGSGWAVIQAVRMPSRPVPIQRRGPPGGAAQLRWPATRTVVRGPDLVVAMRAREFLMVAHRIGSRAMLPACVSGPSPSPSPSPSQSHRCRRWRRTRSVSAPQRVVSPRWPRRWWRPLHLDRGAIIDSS